MTTPGINALAIATPPQLQLSPPRALAQRSQVNITLPYIDSYAHELATPHLFMLQFAQHSAVTLVRSESLFSSFATPTVSQAPSSRECAWMFMTLVMRARAYKVLHLFWMRQYEHNYIVHSQYADSDDPYHVYSQEVDSTSWSVAAHLDGSIFSNLRTRLPETIRLPICPYANTYSCNSQRAQLCTQFACVPCYSCL